MSLLSRLARAEEIVEEIEGKARDLVIRAILPSNGRDEGGGQEGDTLVMWSDGHTEVWSQASWNQYHVEVLFGVVEPEPALGIETAMGCLGIDPSEHTLEQARTLLLSDSWEWQWCRRYIPAEFLVALEEDEDDGCHQWDILTSVFGRQTDETTEV